MKQKKHIWFAIAGIILTLIIAGCGVQTSQKNSAQVEIAEEMKVTADTTLANEGEQINLTLGDNLNRKIIKTGQIGVETKGFESTVNSIFKEVEKIEGFIESSYIEGNSYGNDVSRRTGEIKIRIPNRKFDLFMNQADAFGNVISRSMQGEDVTEAYVDTEARLKSLEVQRVRLMELLEKSGTLEELFAIEKELANVNYEIEQFQGTLNKYDSLIDYATIQITIREVVDYQNTKLANNFGERVANKFESSLKGIKSLGEAVVLLFVGIIPFVVVIGIPATVIVILIAILRKKLRGKKEEEVMQKNIVSNEEDKNHNKEEK